LSDNVVEDLVKYTRSRTVKNEQQFVLTMLGYISGHMENPKHYISGVLIGTAGSGKSHTQNTVAELVSDDIMYDVTTGSEKAIIYDQYNWNRALIANMDELQKPSDDIIEILKSVHGGEDEEFVYKVTGAGEGADRQTDGITLQAVPYWFLYAQYEPDFEMWDRLLKVPVHESGEKNEGVARTHWGHSMVSFGDSDKNYMFDFDEGTAALKDHIRELPQDAWVSFPSEVGEDVHGGSFYENVSEVLRSCDDGLFHALVADLNLPLVVRFLWQRHTNSTGSVELSVWQSTRSVGRRRPRPSSTLTTRTRTLKALWGIYERRTQALSKSHRLFRCWLTLKRMGWSRNSNEQVRVVGISISSRRGATSGSSRLMTGSKSCSRGQ